MHSLSRRLFTKQLLAASILPFAQSYPQDRGAAETQSPSPFIPDSVAGHKLLPDEQQLAAKYVSALEKKLKTLRNNELPNNLPPAIFYASPRMKTEAGGHHDK